jgi:hypothetical protein
MIKKDADVRKIFSATEMRERRCCARCVAENVVPVDDAAVIAT